MRPPSPLCDRPAEPSGVGVRVTLIYGNTVFLKVLDRMRYWVFLNCQSPLVCQPAAGMVPMFLLGRDLFAPFSLFHLFPPLWYLFYSRADQIASQASCILFFQEK
jgi:hypothetical protein